MTDRRLSGATAEALVTIPTESVQRRLSQTSAEVLVTIPTEIIRRQLATLSVEVLIPLSPTPLDYGVTAVGAPDKTLLQKQTDGTWKAVRPMSG